MQLEECRKLFPIRDFVVIRNYFNVVTINVVKEVRDSGHIVVECLKVINESGRSYDSGVLESNIGKEFTIDIKDLTNGTYQVRRETDAWYLKMCV